MKVELYTSKTLTGNKNTISKKLSDPVIYEGEWVSNIENGKQTKTLKSPQVTILRQTKDQPFEQFIYAYIKDDFNSLGYFIVDIVKDTERHYTLRLELDLLYTYRGQIRELTIHSAYDNTGNKYVDDSRLTLSSKKAYEYKSQYAPYWNNPWVEVLINGNYPERSGGSFLGVKFQLPAGSRAFAMYDEVGAFINELYSNDLADLLNEKIFGKIKEGVAYMRLLPSALYPKDTLQEHIVLGNATLDLASYSAVANTSEFDTGGSTVTELYGNFLDYEPYTTIQYYVRGVGYIDLIPSQVMDKKVYTKYKYDYRMGVGVAQVYVGSQIIYTAPCQPFQDISLDSVSTSNMISALSSTARTAGGIIGAGLVASGAGVTVGAGAVAIGSTISNATNFTPARNQSQPSTGTWLAEPDNFIVISRPLLVNDITTTFGRPSGRIDKITNFSGNVYADYVDPSGLNTPFNDEIISLLLSGFQT